jgi:hypothetical protein
MNGNQFISFFDWLLLPIFIIPPILYVLYYRDRFIEDKNERYFFLSGFLLKIFGSITAVLIYVYYYKGGDTTSFYENGVVLNSTLFKDPSLFINLFSYKGTKEIYDFNLLEYAVKMNVSSDPAVYLVVKIASILGLLCFNSFLIISILCSYFAFFASWKFYKMFIEMYPELKKPIGFAIFFMPSVVFWGSGLFKDTFTLAGLYLFIYSIYMLFIKRKLKLSNLLYLYIGLMLMAKIRSFFLLTILPFMILWIFLLNFYNIKNNTARFFFIPFFAVFISIAIPVILSQLTANLQELNTQALLDKSKGFQGWHGSLGGSVYTLGEIEYSNFGIIKKIPAAINVALFRPYIIEVTKPIVFISFLQSFFFLLFTLYVVLKTRIIFFVVTIFKSATVISFLFFSLTYAFVAGFTSFNFGALDRYKIPSLSIYIICLIIVRYEYRKFRTLRKN